MTENNILEKAQARQQQISAWRREFHTYPELGFQETRTARRVAEILEGLGWRVRRGVGRTGVVAELGSGTPIAAMRADMDALPILEENSVDYASLHPGQLAVSALVGLVAASWIAVGFLWGWGQTPGLNLLGAGADRKVSLGRSLGFWLVWLLVLPLAGLPLLVGRRGARGAERLLGASLSSR